MLSTYLIKVTIYEFVDLAEGHRFVELIFMFLTATNKHIRENLKRENKVVTNDRFVTVNKSTQ